MHKPWSSFIGSCKKDQSHGLFSTYSRVVYLWIKSWFSYIETEAEFTTSYRNLLAMLVTHREILGHKLVHHVKDLINSITKSIQYAGHHHFIHSTTFGFLGSTIVEVSNAALKSGDHRCRPSMGIDTSSMKQLDAVDAKTFRDNVKMAAHINETSHYTRSLTNPYLTRYMEGLVVKNFDNRINFTSCYCGNLEWMVMEKDLLGKMIEHSKNGSPLTDTKEHPTHTKFVRVRRVRIVHNKYITCTCGYVQNYLSPCHHIMNVLWERRFVLPSLFHIRWYKHFNYYFGDEFCSNQMKDFHASMKDLYNKCHDECYDENGRYMGCNITGNPFVLKDKVIDTTSEERITMDAIERYTFQIGPLEKFSSKYTRFIPWSTHGDKDGTIDHDKAEEDENEKREKIIHEMDEYGFGFSNPDDTFPLSQTVEGGLSQQSIELEKIVERHNELEDIHQKGGDLSNRVEAFMSTIKTVEQKNRFIEFMRSESARNTQENNPSYKNDSVGTLILGSDESGKVDSGKRRLYSYEK